MSESNLSTEEKKGKKRYTFQFVDLIKVCPS